MELLSEGKKFFPVLGGGIWGWGFTFFFFLGTIGDSRFGETFLWRGMPEGVYDSGSIFKGI